MARASHFRSHKRKHAQTLKTKSDGYYWVYRKRLDKNDIVKKNEYINLYIN